MNKLYKILTLSLVILFIIFLLSFCTKSKPSIVFFPDMYYSVAYDPNQEAVQPYISTNNTVPIFKNKEGQTALLPVKGTISRNKKNILLTDDFNNSIESYEKSKNNTISPLSKILDRDIVRDLERGRKLYEQNCVICHGVNGDGNGPIVENGSYNGVPKYADREISIGSVYYVITYGKNVMGSYAANINQLDRWRIAEYIINSFKHKKKSINK